MELDEIFTHAKKAPNPTTAYMMLLDCLSA